MDTTIEVLIVAGLVGYVCFKIFGDDSSQRAIDQIRRDAAARQGEEERIRIRREEDEDNNPANWYAD